VVSRKDYPTKAHEKKKQTSKSLSMSNNIKKKKDGNLINKNKSMKPDVQANLKNQTQKDCESP
jgi:hypothetical protein